MKLIVGLGNPGVKYRFTRHNIGFLVVERLIKEAEVKSREKKFNSRLARAKLAKRSILLIRPYTYMNLSGKAILSFLKWAKLNLEDLLVVCDDVNLRFTAMRIKPRGSSGGHNGLKSIIDSLGTKDFPRLRLGIGPACPVRNEISNRVCPQDKVLVPSLERNRKVYPLGLEKYVLGQFTPQQKKLMGEFMERAAEVSRVWVSQGIETAMHRFNVRGK